jgi:hypothetical protein
VRALLVGVAAVLVLTACESSPPAGEPPASAAAPGPASPTGSAPATTAPAPGPAGSSPPPFAAPDPSGTPPGGHEVTTGGRTVKGVAPGLDLPPGSRVAESFTNGESTTVILSAPKPSAVLAHYRKQGPAAGYELGTDTAGLLMLRGRGWSVGVATQASDSTLTFQVVPADAPTDPVTPAW